MPIIGHDKTDRSSWRIIPKDPLPKVFNKKTGAAVGQGRSMKLVYLHRDVCARANLWDTHIDDAAWRCTTLNNTCQILIQQYLHCASIVDGSKSWSWSVVAVHMTWFTRERHIHRVFAGPLSMLTKRWRIRFLLSVFGPGLRMIPRERGKCLDVGLFWAESVQLSGRHVWGHRLLQYSVKVMSGASWFAVGYD